MTYIEDYHGFRSYLGFFSMSSVKIQAILSMKIILLYNYDNREFLK